MFEALSASLSSALKSLRGRGRLTEANMREGLAEVRTALLEADVAYDVAEGFLDRDVAGALPADPGDLLEVARRLLHGDHPRVLRETEEGVGLDVRAGPRRDVVDDDRQVPLVRHCPEVGVEHPLVGPVVVGRDDALARDAGAIDAAADNGEVIISHERCGAP